MHLLLEILCKEQKRVQEKIESLNESAEADKKQAYEKHLEEINNDINRLEQMQGRPSLQTFSEMIYIDDIRLRVNNILKNNND